MGLEPISSENATVATSAPPSKAPMVKAQAINGARMRHGIGPPDDAVVAPVALGSVDFWLTSTVVPATVAMMAQESPARGWTIVARATTRAGPTMNTVSSTTASKANAVCRSRLSSTRCDHRARIEDPICGSAAPATAALRWGQGAR